MTESTNARCFAADGATQTYTVPGLPILVNAVDFNRVYSELASLRTELAVQGEPVPTATRDVLERWEKWASSTGLDEKNHDLCDALKEIRASLDAIEMAFHQVLVAVQIYLPPDGITKDEFINRVIACVDPWPTTTTPQPATSAKADQTYTGDDLAMAYKDGYAAGGVSIAQGGAKDAERLDWLVAQGLIFAYPVKYRHGNFTELKFGSGIAVEKVFTSEVRQAIDAAIASQKGG